MITIAAMLVSVVGLTANADTFPGAEWETRTPEQVGMDPAKLKALAEFMGGRGCVVRHGYMVYTWGDATKREDVASACKPWYSHFLFKAVEEGLLPGVDTPVVKFEPRLNDINANLEHKDRTMTFSHMATQTSCYGVREAPGTAYDYNDFQMALFFDTLFLKVYREAYEEVDEQILHKRLTSVMQCQDNPTFFAFKRRDRAGRCAVSPRDFARFGLLYLHEGNWNGTQLISREHARQAVRSPLPLSIPRTRAVAAEMCPEQRTIGSLTVPDDQADHNGSYSWLWWINGVERNGKRHWPDVPVDVYAALGHRNGMRGMAVFPSLDVVMSWNDTNLENMPEESNPQNEAFSLLCESVRKAPMAGQVITDPASRATLARAGGDDTLATPVVLCGPGDPEGFLYRGTRRDDGTRDGDQERIIGKLAGTGANCIYLEAVRSHGGDGGPLENPFVNGDPAKRLDEHILAQWETWFRSMDENGITVFFIFYDDSARIWDTGNTVSETEQTFVKTLVHRFDQHRNWIWCIAEEYAEAYTAARVRNLASLIRAADGHNHVIAVHKNDGLSFDEFADDPNIGLFAVQYNHRTPEELNAGVASARKQARGRYAIVMSEASNYGVGIEAQRKNWACALAGASVMALGWNFDKENLPSAGDLKACGRLVNVLESADVKNMEPHNELAYEGTAFVLADPGRAYVAYAYGSHGPVGLRGLLANDYTLTWIDPASTSLLSEQSALKSPGDKTWPIPTQFSGDVVLCVRRARE